MSTTSDAVASQDKVAPSPYRTLPGDHRFYSAMAIVSAIAILAGFSRTYAPKIVSGAPAVPPVVHLHALVFTSWLVLFVVQTSLVRTGRTAVHRRLGLAGVGLAALMLVVGSMTAIAVARLGHRGISGVEFPDPEGFLLLNLASIVVFAILVAAGWLFRRNAAAHKRLMLMATTGALVGPGVSRLPFAAGRPPVIALLALAFLLAGPVHDLVTRRRVHPAYIAAVVLAFATVPPVVAQLAATPGWHAVAAALLR